MIAHKLIQGSDEWHAHRAEFDNASDAPAMLGESPYKTRTELIAERATGITKEHDKATQARFAEGHDFEAMARPVAEKIVGESLYPVTGTNGTLGASFDGLTMMEDIAMEHKRLNNDIRACNSVDELPIMYRIQMEQQLMVSEETEKVLFLATNWDGETLIEEKHFWYTTDTAIRNRIIAGWIQFHKDVDSYIPAEVIEKPKAEAIEAFPVPSIQVRGELVSNNLAEIMPKFDKYLEETNTNLVTDQDFADGEANAKKSREAAKNLKLTAKAVVDQIAPVSEVVSTLELYADKFNMLGLKLEKAVTQQKETIKTNAILKAKQDMAEHINELEKEISPLRLNCAQPDFATAIRGLKTIVSLHNKIADALAAGKITADAAARDIRAKLSWYRECAKDYTFLFADLAQIIVKAEDDFQLVVKTRIDARKVEDVARAAKIKADAEAEIKAQQEREEDARQQREYEATLTKPEPVAEVKQEVKAVTIAESVTRPADSAGEPAKPTLSVTETLYYKGHQPTPEELVMAVAYGFKVEQTRALEWLKAANFNGLKLAA